ncbi:MAG: hypothetical protein AAF745_18700, partial [Planctomycetota bacterium]
MSKRALKFFAAVAIGIAASGCGGQPSTSAPTDGPQVKVVYGTDPLADVEVRLHATATGPVIAQTISS